MSWFTRCIFSLIAVTALFGNILVLYTYVKARRRFSKKPFDIFVINLAIADMLTAFFLVFSRFVYLPPVPGNQFGAFLHCNFLWGGFILFGLGYVSVYTCLALTIERWLAINRPQLYRRVTTTYVIMPIFFIWIWGFFINSTVFISVKVNVKDGKCNWGMSTDGSVSIVLSLLEVTASSLAPFSAILILYVHIFYKIKNSVILKDNQHSAIRKRLTKIAFATSFAIIVGWSPAKISYMLRFTSVGERHLQSYFHLFFIMLAMANSCVNPVVYGIFSNRFRKEYSASFRQVFGRFFPEKASAD